MLDHLAIAQLEGVEGIDLVLGAGCLQEVSVDHGDRVAIDRDPLKLGPRCWANC